MSTYVHPTAIVDEDVVLGEGTKVWHFVHVSKGARLGDRCILGQNVFIGPGVVLGRGVKGGGAVTFAMNERSGCLGDTVVLPYPRP